MFAWSKEHPFLFCVMLSLSIHVAGLGAARMRQSRVSEVFPLSLQVEVLEAAAPTEGKESIPPAPPAAPRVETEAPPPPLPRTEPPPPPLPVAPPAPLPVREIAAAPAAVSTPFVSAPPSREEVLQAYMYCLCEEIERESHLPEAASKMGMTGSVVVCFTLQSDGRMREYYIPAGGESSYSPFNREALRAVLGASPNFPSFPEGLSEETLNFRLPVSFVPSRPGGSNRRSERMK